MENIENNQKYGLFTAITMIMGVMIGSGIFFKTDDVLAYTGGNVLLGVLIFLIAAIAIIFGSLSISQLAMRTDKSGGLIAYAEEFVNKETAVAFGWFQVFLYLPAIVAIVGWVAGVYICQLFNIDPEGGFINPYTIGVVIILSVFGVNILSSKFGGYFQNAAMIIKLIPLFIFAIFGLIKGDVAPVIHENIDSIKTAGVSVGILAAFAPIAFSFDGWTVATALGHEIKNSKRNLPIALIVSPILVLIIYIAYFLGVSIFVGPQEVLALGNDSTNKMAQVLFGQAGAKVMIVFVVISVLGTVNGVIMALMRMPYSLAIRNMLPASDILRKENKSLNNMPLNSSLLGIVICLFWILMHYITQKQGMKGDISEIGICFSYINYSILYVTIIRLARKGEIKNKFMGYVVPVIAIFGAIIILVGSLSNPMSKYYFAVCIAIMVAGYLFYKNRKVQ